MTWLTVLAKFNDYDKSPCIYISCEYDVLAVPLLTRSQDTSI